MPESLHLQISGALPWCVLGWRTFEHEDVSPELAAVYGPVASKDAAERLVETLGQLIPGAESVMKFTVVPIFPVLSLAAGAGVAPS